MPIIVTIVFNTCTFPYPDYWLLVARETRPEGLCLNLRCCLFSGHWKSFKT